MSEFAWLWPIFAAAVVIAFLGLSPDKGLWHLRFDATELLMVTPWGGIWLAHEAFDPADYAWWTGIEIFRRIPKSQKPHRIFQPVFRHEMRRTYIEV